MFEWIVEMEVKFTGVEEVGKEVWIQDVRGNSSMADGQGWWQETKC